MSGHDVAILQALEASGTRVQVLERLHERGHDLTDEQLQAVLDAHVAEYRVLCGAGGVYVRLPAGARAVADHALRQDGRA